MKKNYHFLFFFLLFFLIGILKNNPSVGNPSILFAMENTTELLHLDIKKPVSDLYITKTLESQYIKQTPLLYSNNLCISHTYNSGDILTNKTIRSTAIKKKVSTKKTQKNKKKAKNKRKTSHKKKNNQKKANKKNANKKKTNKKKKKLKTIRWTLSRNKRYISDSLQDALDFAAKDKNHKYIIRVRKGSYRIRRPIYIHGSNITLDLRGVTLRRDNPRSCFIRMGTLGGIRYNGAQNIRILGGTFKGGSKRNSADIMVFAHVQNIRIENAVFRYMPSKKLRASDTNAHMIEFSAAKNVVIKNCKFYNNRRCKINNEAVQIESATKSKALDAHRPSFGILDGTQTKNVTITGCYFKGFRYGCGSNHLTFKDRYTNMRFTNNTFIGAKKFAICLFRYHKVYIKGNRLKGCGRLYQNQYSTKIYVK